MLLGWIVKYTRLVSLTWNAFTLVPCSTQQFSTRHNLAALGCAVAGGMMVKAFQNWKKIRRSRLALGIPVAHNTSGTA
jgi:hypothetical protein